MFVSAGHIWVNMGIFLSINDKNSIFKGGLLRLSFVHTNESQTDYLYRAYFGRSGQKSSMRNNPIEQLMTHFEAERIQISPHLVYDVSKFGLIYNELLE
jgi:hypothetical protein